MLPPGVLRAGSSWVGGSTLLLFTVLSAYASIPKALLVSPFSPFGRGFLTCQRRVDGAGPTQVLHLCRFFHLKSLFCSFNNGAGLILLP